MGLIGAPWGWAGGAQQAREFSGATPPVQLFPPTPTWAPGEPRQGPTLLISLHLLSSITKLWLPIPKINSLIPLIPPNPLLLPLT